MVLAFVIFNQWSSAFLALLSVIILIFLFRSIQITNKLWLASVVSAVLIGIISVAHIFAYNSLLDRLKNQEAALEEMKSKYETMKAETAAARETYNDSRANATSSKEDLEKRKAKLNTEFDKAVGEIRSVYAGISDEELDRRVNSAVRKARQNLQHNVFQ